MSEDLSLCPACRPQEDEGLTMFTAVPRFTEVYVEHGDQTEWCENAHCQSAYRRNVLGHDELPNWKQERGTIVALDCEFVGVGKNGRRNALARVSIVNVYSHCIYDTFVRPNETVRDYRTAISGVRASDVKFAPSFWAVRRHVLSILKDRILVGHAVHHDLRVLQIEHPTGMLRDTATWPAYQHLVGRKQPGLKALFEAQFEGLTVQRHGYPHNSIEDARAAMALYRNVHDEWI